MTPITFVVKRCAHFLNQRQRLLAHLRRVRQPKRSIRIAQQPIGWSNAGGFFKQQAIRRQLHQIGLIRARCVPPRLDFHGDEASTFLDQVIRLSDQSDPPCNQRSLRRLGVGIAVHHRRPGKTGGGAQAKGADQRDQCQQKQSKSDGDRHRSTRHPSANQERQRKRAKERGDDGEQATQGNRSCMAVMQCCAILTPCAFFRFKPGDPAQPPGARAVDIFANLAGAYDW